MKIVHYFDNLFEQVAQPGVEGLYWMQIEDFVELFNRVYIIEDLMWQEDMVTKRFLSKWVPGDFIAGSGGPPIDTTPPKVQHIDPGFDNESKDDGSLEEGKVDGGDGLEEEDDEEDEDESDDDQPVNPFTDNPMYPFVVSEPTAINIVLYQPDRRYAPLRIYIECSLKSFN